MRRAAALALVLFAAYAATVGLDASGRSAFAGNEPHNLLIAQSVVEDHDVDVKNQYAARSYEPYYPGTLRPHGRETRGFLHEIHGVGFPLLISPAYRVGGATGVELFLAAIAAVCMALAYRLALRAVPDPWALGATLAVGLSPPMVAYSTTVSPETTAALILVGAALLALELDEHVTRHRAFTCLGLLGLLPWLGVEFAPAGVVVGAYAIRSLARARRRTLALGSSELAFFSLALYVGVNEALFEGPTPYSADTDGDPIPDAGGLLGHLRRSYRLVALLIDRDNGLLRWAPVFCLAFVGAWMLYRARRDQLTRAVPQLRSMERAATMCALGVGLQLAVAAFAAPTIGGPWFPPRHLIAALPLAVPLVAVGLRHLPRVGTALGALSVAASVWLWVAVRYGSDALVGPRPDAPFGPLVVLFPRFGDAAWPYVLAGAIGLAVVVTALLELRRWRHGSAAAWARITS